MTSVPIPLLFKWDSNHRRNSLELITPKAVNIQWLLWLWANHTVHYMWEWPQEKQNKARWFISSNAILEVFLNKCMTHWSFETNWCWVIFLVAALILDTSLNSHNQIFYLDNYCYISCSCLILRRDGDVFCTAQWRTTHVINKTRTRKGGNVVRWILHQHFKHVSGSLMNLSWHHSETHTHTQSTSQTEHVACRSACHTWSDSVAQAWRATHKPSWSLFTPESADRTWLQLYST